MRNKNLILLTSITALLLTPTPYQALTQESTTPTTKTTSRQDKLSTKTSTKSNDKSITSTTTNKDKEDTNTTTPTNSETTTTPNQVKTPKQVNTPNNPNQEFMSVNNSKPGTFNGGVSSSVDGEELSDDVKVDTGSPTTSILNKIRTIF